MPLLSIVPILPAINYFFLFFTQSVLNHDGVFTSCLVYSYNIPSHLLAYKSVVKKNCMVIAPLDEEFHVLSTLPEDPLTMLKPLPSHPPDFIPGQYFTQERADSLYLDPTNWL